MLRFLGIPARVAGGFTSGKHEGDSWVVTDHNAHAWVEVVVPGYGWLAFDPTPGRGSLTGNYSASSTDSTRATRPMHSAGRPARRRKAARASSSACCRRSGSRSGSARAELPQTTAGRLRFWLLLLVGVVAVGAIGAAKVVRRRLRYLTRDPRRLAGAARRELADFLVDQGLEVRPSATPDELRQLVRRRARRRRSASSRPRSPRRDSGRPRRARQRRRERTRSCERCCG